MTPDFLYRNTGGSPDIAYTDSGGQAGHAVVLLHSLGTDHRIWADTAAALATEYRVLVPDSRGHGESQWDGYLTCDDWVTDLDGVLDHAGVRSAALVGVSMGGVQSIAYAAHHRGRVAALVVADSFAELDPEVARAKTAGLAERARNDGMAALADFYVSSTFTVDPLPATAESVRAAIASMDPDAYVASTETCFGVRLGDALGRIESPALVLWGERDAKTPRDLSEHIARDISGATLEVVPDAGHLSNAENPEAFTALVRKFLADYTSGK